MGEATAIRSSVFPLETSASPPEPIAVIAPPRLAPHIGSTIKHYEILRQLGQGGMGTVFLARDTKLGRLVAIKVLMEPRGHWTERFLAEARATALCKHENIVVIHEVDEFRGYPYMVLEYLEGRTLREWMAERAPTDKDSPSGLVSPSLAVELMIPVVRALCCAHKLGIVHRDLKPANIFLTDAGPTKVLDFGLAKRLAAHELPASSVRGELLAASAEVTQDGALLGTYPYMSPEQWRCEEIDARSDLWAVGIILYELCTGAHPLAPLTMDRLSETSDLDIPMPSVGERRKDVGALGAVIHRCLKKRKAERIGSAEALLGELEQLLPGRKALALGEDDNPFAGLAAFQEADAVRFFGRDREVQSVLGRLRHQPLVAVAGPSGVGKSSFVRAGVIAALKRSGEDWEAYVLRPGRRPLGALTDVLAQIAETTGERGRASEPPLDDPEQIAEAVRSQPGLLGARLRARCLRQGGGHRILLFVDQLEELYTLGTEPAERAAFIACLLGAADDASSPLRVVLSTRSDFLHRIAESRPFLTEVTRGLLLLPPMGREGLREALMRPIEGAGYRFESEDMVSGMLGALESTQSPLPLLQFTAAKLWEARDRERRLLTRESYDKLGGVAGALSTHADAVLAGLSPADQGLCRAVLLRLVTPERTRAVVSLGELYALAEDNSAVEQVVHHLCDARLLLIEPSSEREGSTVELIHESLIDRWAKLTQWLNESDQDMQVLARLRAAAQQWEAGEEAEGLLWRDRAAEDARAWHERRRAEQGATTHLGLARREERYLVAVIALSERARRRRRQIAAGIFATLGAIAVVVSLLAIQAKREAARAEAEARQARNATRMATARELEQKDPTTALALLREVEPPGVPRGWGDLALGVLHSGITSVMLSHPDAVQSAAFSPDGRRIVTASEDKTVRVWSADGTGEPIILHGHEDRITSAAFSPDGRRIVTASADKTVRVWNADGAGGPRVVLRHEDAVLSAAFDPDGQHIVTTSRDKTARVWNADGTGEPIVLRMPGSEIYVAAWSLDGKRIITAGNDDTARVWNADGSGEPWELRGDWSWISAVAFSPDGKRIGVASSDKNVRVWNADGTGEPRVLRGHESAIYSVAFSPDGQRILTASRDKTARVWNVDGTGEPVIFREHADSVHLGAFSPDGQSIVTPSDDTTVRVWKADGTGEALVLLGHTGRVYGAAFSPDGRRIVTVSEDKTARVWNADGIGESWVFRGHTDVVYSAAWSPDGQRIVTASEDKTAQVWDADGIEEPRIVLRHEGVVYSAAWSPDGRHVVTGSKDKFARLWDADEAREIRAFRGHAGSVSAAFSPDGQRIVTASEDKTARVWNADGTGEAIILRGHEGGIAMAAFCPDGRRIVTASKDKTVQVWNADGTGESLVLRGHEGEVYGATWSPDGRRIITTSEDKTARIWSDLTPLHGTDDLRLWTASPYCMSIERRIDLLHVSEATARADQSACQRRVKEALAGSMRHD